MLCGESAEYRLKSAGAVLVAKLVSGSLAYDDIWFGGRTRNPWNIEEFSTGSSAGPAACTSAGSFSLLLLVVPLQHQFPVSFSATVPLCRSLHVMFTRLCASGQKINLTKL